MNPIEKPSVYSILQIPNWFNRLPIVDKVSSVVSKIEPEPPQIKEKPVPLALSLLYQTAWSVWAFETIPKFITWKSYVPYPGNGYFEGIWAFLCAIDEINKDLNLSARDHSENYEKIFNGDSALPMDQQANYSVEIFFIALRMVLGDLPQVSSDHDIWKPAHDHTKETQEAACQLYSHTLALLGYARDRDLQHFLSVHALFDQAWYTFCEQLIQEKNSFGCSWYGFIQIKTIVRAFKRARYNSSP